MVSFFRGNRANRLLLSVVLTTFTLTYATPLPAVQFQAGLNEVAFMVRIEKLVEKLVKSEGKGIDKMIDALIDIKSEIESTYNTSLNIDHYMDQVSKEISKKGVKPPKKEFDAIKKKLKKKDKKSKHHARYLADTMYVEGYQMNAFDEEMLFASYDQEFVMAKHGKDKDKDKEDKEEVVIPALLVYGVTCSLCGLFLMVLPIPVCKDWGARMVVAGVTACANSLCSKADENNKKDKDKK